MRDLHISVKDKVATYLTRDGYIVCGNSDYQIEFTFDDDWKEATNITARFIWKGKEENISVGEDNICEVPIINGTDEVIVGVYADGISSTPVIIPCKRSILCTS